MALFIRFSILEVLQEFLVGVDVIFQDFGESFFDEGVIFFDPFWEFELLLEFVGLFGMVEGVKEIGDEVDDFFEERGDFGHWISRLD